MNIPIADSSVDGINRQRNAFWAAIILLAAIAVNIVLSFSLGVQSGAWQHFARGGVIVVFGLITLYGLWLIQHRQSVTGIWWIISAFWVALLLTATFLADFGIVLGLIEVLIASLIATYTLPPKQVGWAIGISVAFAIATVGVDVIDPAFRLPAPDSLKTALPIIASVVLVLNVILILQQFMSLPLRGKLIVVLTGITTLTTIIVGGFFIYTIVSDLRARIAAEQIDDLDAKIANTESFLADAQSDVLFLSQSLPMAEYLEAVAEGEDEVQMADGLADLEAEFRIFAQNRPVYDQVRFLDVTGQEIARIEVAPDGRYYAVAQENLQNKGDQYYFRNSIGLDAGEIYISPLDLNVEEDQIETPHKPVIRYSTPVFHGGEVAGVIVTNILAENFLASLGLGESPAFLVDEDGYYLYHPNEDKRWGRDLETGIKVSDDYPDLIDSLFSGRVDTFDTADQLLAYMPVTIPGERTPRWYLVNFRPDSEALAPVDKAQNVGVLLLGGTILFAAVIATVISRVLSSPLVSLTQAAEEVAAGDLDVRVSVERQDEVGKLAGAFNAMADRVQGLVGSLETIVAERTRDLELAAEVGHAVSQVRDEATLLAEAVEIIRSRFDLYYTQIYLVDDLGHNLVLKEGTGEVGRQLVARGHRLSIGPGSINGMVAAQKKAILVPDTAVSPIFFPNPLLPDTRSEMAVPLLVGDQVVGVLDLQSDKPHGLTADVLPAFEALAGQLAVSVRNANLFTEVVEARLELEAQAQLMAHAGWENYLNAVELREYIGYRYEDGAVEGLSEPLAAVDVDGRSLETPVVISGEPIGAIRLETPPEETITEDDAQMIASVAQQVAQRIENLRLLGNAERYRAEAEMATRRLTHEGWRDYLATADLAHLGYRYDNKEVAPFDDMPEEGDQLVKQELTVSGEPMGYLAVADVDETDAETMELVTAVTQQLSAHIETLRLAAQTEGALAETEQQAQRLALLNEMSAEYGQAGTLDEVFIATARYTRRILGGDRAGMALLDDTGEKLTMLAIDSQTGAITSGEGLPVIGTAMGTAVTEQRLLYLPDIEPGDHLDSKQRLEHGIHAALVAPLITPSGVLGAVSVGSHRRHAFDADDENLLRQIASLLAVTIESRRLFGEAQARAQHEQLLRQVSSRVHAAIDAESVLRIAAQEVSRALGVKAFAYLDKPESDNLKQPSTKPIKKGNGEVS
jgi:GAF domain-containing protein/HAMP domain-containing protein